MAGIHITYSLPDAVGTIRPATHDHLAVHIELHRLHLRFFFVAAQSHLLLSSRVVK